MEHQHLEFARKCVPLLDALSDVTRLKILLMLDTLGETSAPELAATLRQSNDTLAAHLMELKNHQLVAARRNGSTVYYRLRDREIGRMLAMVQSMFSPEPADDRRRAKQPHRLVSQLHS